MIELHTLPMNTRQKLARKSEPFFLAYKRNNVFVPTFKAISNVVDKPKLYEAEIWTLISATTQAVRYDTDACQFSFSNDNYITANKITKKNISCSKMTALVAELEEKGYLTKYKGFKFEDSDSKGVAKAMRSIIVFHTPWFAMFDVLKCKLHGTARDFELVILKDKNGNVISHKGMRGIGDEKALLKMWNTQLHSDVITIEGEVVKPLYNSVFNNGSLELGGRCFSNISNERSVVRPTIEINKNPTVEIDYKNNHYRILWNEYGYDYQEDAYAIECPEGWDAKELRSLTKLAGVIMLNAKSKNGARASLLQKLLAKEDGEQRFKGLPLHNDTVKYVMSKMEERHSVIKNHFYKAEWDRLQNIDSKMCKHIVKAFIVKGASVLTYHDSFLCEAKHKDFLIQMMKEAWEVVLGDNKGFGYDIEFDNGVQTSTYSYENSSVAGVEHTLDLIPMEYYIDDCNRFEEVEKHLNKDVAIKNEYDNMPASNDEDLEFWMSLVN